VVNFTIRNGYTPDAAFVSHSDDDHFSGIVALYNAGLLDKVYCSWQERDIVLQAMPTIEIVGLGAGDVVWLDEVTKVTVLHPKNDIEFGEKNDASLVLLLEYNGSKVLFTGDISGAIETYLFENIGEVDIYKAAHHGSKFSSYRLPLSILSPRYSVVCVGDNNYGHPHEWAMVNLEDYSERVYTTKEDYAIVFNISNDINSYTYRERE
jgi:competence protein ComEC